MSHINEWRDVDENKSSKTENLDKSLELTTLPWLRQVTVLPDKKQKYTTRVVRNTQDPSFNEEFVFALRRIHLDNMALRLTVCDYDKFSRRLVLGHVLFPLGTANISSRLTADVVTGETWLPLEERLPEHEVSGSDESYHWRAGRLWESFDYSLSWKILQTKWPILLKFRHKTRKSILNKFT